MFVYFLIGGALASLIVAITRPMAWLWKLVLILIALAVAAAGWLMFPDQRFLADLAWYDTSPVREAILFALMLAGMAARTLSVAIEQRRAAIKHATGSAALPLRLDAWDFVYPFLAAFITFGTVIELVGADPLGIPQLILAFQNGFFWQTLINRSQ